MWEISGRFVRSLPSRVKKKCVYFIHLLYIYIYTYCIVYICISITFMDWKAQPLWWDVNSFIEHFFKTLQKIFIQKHSEFIYFGCGFNLSETVVTPRGRVKLRFLNLDIQVSAGFWVWKLIPHKSLYWFQLPKQLVSWLLETIPVVILLTQFYKYFLEGLNIINKHTMLQTY